MEIQSLINIIFIVCILYLLINKVNEHLSFDELTDEEKALLDKNKKNSHINFLESSDIEAIINISNFIKNNNIPIPKGSIVAYHGDSPPLGWKICDGQNGTPDLRGRFILAEGQGSGLTNRQKNQKGGSETHKLTIKQMPHHGHHFQTQGHHRHYSGLGEGRVDGWHWGFSGSPNNMGSHGGVDTDNVAWGTSATGNHNHNFHAEGGNESHNNMPPFYVLMYIMKI